MNSPSDEEIETSHADSDFKTVKVNKFQRKVRSDQLVIESYNLFEKFNDQEFQVQVAEDHNVLEEKVIDIKENCHVIQGSRQKSNIKLKIPLAPMGVLAHGSAHA